MSSYLTAYIAPTSPFDRPSLLYLVLSQPVKTLLRLLDHGFSLLRTSAPKPTHPVRIVCLSDTHCLKPRHVPSGDILVHAGDLTNAGTPSELQDQIDWLASLPHRHKIVIAGNHDTYLDPRSRRTLSPADQNGALHWRGIRYLQHSSTTLTINGRALTIFGAPQIPACGGEEFAFQYPRGQDAWCETIPPETDILVTHTPPKHHLDLPPSSLGCEHLAAEVARVQPLVHIFGHVHSGRSDWNGWLKGGREVVRWDEGQAALAKGMGRGDGVLQVMSPWAWSDVFNVIYHGVGGVLWDWVWGGESERTVTVNAALMFENSGMLGNEVQVVDV